jgi:hypothetical protein
MTCPGCGHIHLYASWCGEFLLEPVHYMQRGTWPRCWCGRKEAPDNTARFAVLMADIQEETHGDSVTDAAARMRGER